MRFGSALLPLAVACIAGASALEASVYTFGPSSRSSTGREPPVVSAEEARLLFAESLGLSRYHTLQGFEESTIELLNTLGPLQKPLFAAEDEDETDKLMIIVEGVDKPEDLMGSSHPASYRISDPPSSSANTRLVIDLLKQDYHRRRSTTHCEQDIATGSPYASVYVEGGYSSNDPKGGCIVRTMATNEERLSQLSNDLELVAWSGHGTKVYQITALERMQQKHGKQDDTTASVMASIKEILVQIGHKGRSQDTIIAIMPTASKLAKREAYAWGAYDVPESMLDARKFPSERPLGGPIAANKLKPKSKGPTRILASNGTSHVNSTMAVCYPREESCRNATNGCSGHGSCYKKYTNRIAQPNVECWACACKATALEGRKGKTVQWAGAACQKKDVSSPFWLLAGLTIFLLLAVTWGVSLLYSIGDEALPSVIGAGVSGPRAQK